VILDVKVTATNLGTGVAFQSLTDRDGSYSFSNCQSATTRSSAEKEGFSTFVASKIHLDLNQVYDWTSTLKFWIHYSAGDRGSEPSPGGDDCSTAWRVIDANQIANMPLLGRNWVNLQQLQPGW